MRHAFIFHGTGGYPEENWFPWLKKELEKMEYGVQVPQFPTPHKQTLEHWFKIFEKHREFYTPDTVLIGHSLGGTFLLRILEEHEVHIPAACLIATPIGIPPTAPAAGDQPFTGHPFDWEKIRSRCDRFFVFHSEDDPYVGLKNGEMLAKHVQTELILVPHAGHFNQAAGYTKFELLLEKIRTVS